MTEPAKNRILDASIRLFARQGYCGTGMRELAKEADVNLAMINYYYGSKRGLLEAIFDTYFEKHKIVIQGLHDLEGPTEERIRWGVTHLIELFRQNPELVRVAFTELPYDVPEIAEYKATKISELVASTFLPMFQQLQAEAPRQISPLMVGPALLGMSMFHFLVRPVLERVFPEPFDDSFYTEYTERIVELFLYGVLGQPPT